MLAIILCGLLASAIAAPHRSSRGFPFDDDDSSFDEIFDRPWMNMGHFWRNFNKEMTSLQERLNEMSKHLPKVSTTETFQGNEYKLTMELSGFQEDDITVKAKQGTLVVEAHNHGNNVINIQSLPRNVGERGNWTYENNILSIVFPVDNTKTRDRTGPNTVIIGDSASHGVGAEKPREPSNAGGTRSNNLKDQVEFIHD